MPIYQNLILGVIDVAVVTLTLFYIYRKTQTTKRYMMFIICLLAYEWSIRFLVGYEFILYTINIVTVVIIYYIFEKNLRKSLGIIFFTFIMGSVQEIVTMLVLLLIKGGDYIISHADLYDFEFLVIINSMGILLSCILILSTDISKLSMEIRDRYEFPLSMIGLNCLCLFFVNRTINFLGGNKNVYVFLVFYVILNIYIIISYNKLEKLNNSTKKNRIISDVILTDVENIKRVQMEHRDKLEDYKEYNEVVILENKMLSVYLSGILMNPKYKAIKFNIDKNLIINDDCLDEFILALDMILNEKTCSSLDISMKVDKIVINFNDMKLRSIIRLFISMPSSMKIRKNYMEMGCEI